MVDTKTYSEQLVEVANGDVQPTDIRPSKALDSLIKVNFRGYEDLVVTGRPRASFLFRAEHPSISLERFLIYTIDSFYEGERSRLYKAYADITNKMTAREATVIYNATLGTAKIDKASALEYAERRGFLDYLTPAEPKLEGSRMKSKRRPVKNRE